MSKRHKNQNEATVNDVEVTTNTEEKEAEVEVIEKKNIFSKIVDGGKKIVKSTPFKVVAGVIIGAGAAIGGKALLDYTSGNNTCDDEFDDLIADIEAADPVDDTTAETSEN